MVGKWIPGGALAVGDDWAYGSFALGSNIIRVTHSLSFEQAKFHRGVFALTDRQSSIRGLIAAQRIFPTAKSEILVFPKISDLNNVSCAVRQTRSPAAFSWRWRVDVAYWGEFDDLIDEALTDIKDSLREINQKIDSLS